MCRPGPFAFVNFYMYQYILELIFIPFFLLFSKFDEFAFALAVPPVLANIFSFIALFCIILAKDKDEEAMLREVEELKSHKLTAYLCHMCMMTAVLASYIMVMEEKCELTLLFSTLTVVFMMLCVHYNFCATKTSWNIAMNASKREYKKMMEDLKKNGDVKRVEDDLKEDVLKKNVNIA